MELKTSDNRGDSLNKIEKLRTMSYASWRLDIEDVWWRCCNDWNSQENRNTIKILVQSWSTWITPARKWFVTTQAQKKLSQGTARREGKLHQNLRSISNLQHSPRWGIAGNKRIPEPHGAGTSPLTKHGTWTTRGSNRVKGTPQILRHSTTDPGG